MTWTGTEDMEFGSREVSPFVPRTRRDKDEDIRADIATSSKNEREWAKAESIDLDSSEDTIWRYGTIQDAQGDSVESAIWGIATL